MDQTTPFHSPFGQTNDLPVVGRETAQGSPKYRADIDGLRAVAVLGVVTFHAFPEVLRGGFVGVDIFFVISGYLITGIIAGGHRDGTFRYHRFYARRIKRIFPALLLVLCTCYGIGWFTFLPDEFRMLGSHTFAGAGFWINFTFYREAGYFDAKAIFKPLLHLWSLAVEEQFYLLWPPIVALTFRLNRPLLALGLVISALSLALNLLLTEISPAAAFYLPWPRAWELLSGSCLLCLPTGSFDLPPSRWREIASVVGASLILASMLAITSFVPFPGWRALLPVIGTLLVVAAGPKAWLNRSVLAHPWVVFVGLVSYPLYLWHWPLISIPEIIGQGGPLSRAAGVVASFALACITFKFIERPIRHSRDGTSIVLVAAIVLIGSAGLLSKRSLILPRSDSKDLTEILKAESDWFSPIHGAAPLQFEGQTFWRDGDSPEITLFIGDSNAEQYFPRTHELAVTGRAKRSSIFAFYPSCLPLPNVAPVQTPACYAFIDKAFQFAESDNVKVVAIAGYWFGANLENRYYFRSADRTVAFGRSSDGGRALALDALKERLLELRRLGKRTVIILNIPSGYVFIPKVRIKRTIEGVKIAPPYQPTLEEATSLDFGITADLVSVARATGSEIIDPAQFLCTPRCITEFDANIPAYKDGEHLRASYVRGNATFVDDLLR